MCLASGEIYVIRKAQGECFSRLQGRSAILYIGSTQAKKGLKQRLQQYLHPGPTQWTNRRINQLARKCKMEVAWGLSEEYLSSQSFPRTYDSPRSFEHELLVQYLNDHDELPPLNRAGITKVYRIFEDGLWVTGQVKRKQKET